MNTSFERVKTGKDEWLTPPYLTSALGPFDLDPCSPINRPWDTAKEHFTIEDDGLSKSWNGFIWCNPPYGRQTSKWLARCANHYGGCIALTFARTETKMFHEWVFGRAIGLYFLYGRLKFCNADGTRSLNSCGAPSVLIAYGEKAFNRIGLADFDDLIRGTLVKL